MFCESTVYSYILLRLFHELQQSTRDSILFQLSFCPGTPRVLFLIGVALLAAAVAAADCDYWSSDFFRDWVAFCYYCDFFLDSDYGFSDPSLMLSFSSSSSFRFFFDFEDLVSFCDWIDLESTEFLSDFWMSSSSSSLTGSLASACSFWFLFSKWFD